MNEKIKNPLVRRLPREFKKEICKYLALFLLLSVMIGAVSAMYVANDSMGKALTNAYEDYNREDGHFILKNKMSKELDEKIKDKNIKVYEQFYKELDEKINNDDEKIKVRVYANRDEVNKCCLIEGDMPKNDDEIAIDRMHADNKNIKLNDEISLNDKKMKVTGLVAFSDYTSLFKNNSDIMFDAITFDVACVTKDAFDKLDNKEDYEYAFKYNKKPKDNEKEKELSDELIEDLAKYAMEDKNEVLDFVPQYLNQAIHFAPDDMGSDKAMCGVLLYILVFVIGFVFAITASNTITAESAVIGTLRSTGYTKRELCLSYMAMPVLVTFIAAVVGNVLGYTCIKDVVVKLYYNSYSLPKYKTYWNLDAFVHTTLVPVLLVVLINYIVIRKKLNFSPLQFLRKDLSNHKKKKVVKLPNISFFKRFRLRILFKNIPGYVVLFSGILFVNVLLIFAIGLPSTLKKYQDGALDNMIANRQTILKTTKDKTGNEIKTKDKKAEKFSMQILETTTKPHISEKITTYGYAKDSEYFHVDKKLSKGHILVTDAFYKKFSLKKNNKIKLKEEFTDKEYEFVIDDIYDMPGTLGILMPQEDFNKTFNLDKDYFSGYLSDEELKDIDKEYIASVITADDILKLSKQLDHSMGNYMTYFEVVCILMAMVIMYLLTKLIVESNTVSISMIKVLGYTQKEINSLYIRITSLVVLFSAVVTAFISKYLIVEMWKAVMYELNGWLDFYASVVDICEMILFVLIAYAVVVFFDMKRIKKIPLTDALKSVE